MTLADNYPAGMSDCDRIGMGGGCGPDCQVFIRGDCELEDEINESIDSGAMDGDQHLLFETRETR